MKINPVKHMAVKVCFRNDDGELTSAEPDIRKSFLRTIYRKGHLVRPPLGKLFVFDSLKNALIYRKFDSTCYEFWLVEAYNAKPLSYRPYMWMVTSDNKDFLSIFWKRVFNGDNLENATGTDTGVLACDSLRLVRKLTAADA
jgi:hypothetical protein